MEIYSHNFMSADVIQYVLSVTACSISCRVVICMCHVCFAMYDITDAVFGISIKE